MPVEEHSYGVVPYREEGGRVLFLLVLHHAGHWAFPKGHGEGSESELETARREFEEETGVKDYEIENIAFTERYMVPRRPPIQKTVKYFLGRVRDPHFKIQVEEIADAAWLAFDEAMAKMTFEEGRKILIQAKSHFDKKT